jgi:hypothetical protein
MKLNIVKVVQVGLELILTASKVFSQPPLTVQIQTMMAFAMIMMPMMTMMVFWMD